jgi:hypothetical protein
MADEMSETAPTTTETTAPAETAPAEPAAVETPPAAPAEPDPAERALAAKHAELRRHKRDLEARVASERAQVEAERVQLKDALEVVEKLRSGDILEALERLGIGADALVTHLEEAATLSPDVRRMKKQLAEMQAEKVKLEKEQRDRETEQRALTEQRQLAAGIQKAVDESDHPKVRALDPEERAEFTAALVAEARAVLRRGETARLDEIAERIFTRVEKAAKIHSKWSAPATEEPTKPGKPGVKTPPKPGGSSIEARIRSAKTDEERVAIILGATPAEQEALARL